MHRRLFLGIDVPPTIKKHFTRKVERYRNLPMLFGREENFQITVVFLGSIDDENLPALCASIAETCTQFEIFDVCFNKIHPAPKLEAPRMLWASGELSEELQLLREALEKVTGVFQREKKSFSPHITLGRIKTGKWNSLDPRPDIQDAINIVVPVGSVTLFESAQVDGKSTYVPLEEFPLGE